ncbi:tetrapyrrole biosynthesis uroporphyrinogen III synthase [Panus rudis PR-1116 ss-1]|nr:tetrapyrrole biosynthesis uroporphyrinogen III synthase [Panus rudis PR-1116 ss-1]
MPNVILLRAPTPEADAADKYEAAFLSRGFHPVSVPVLETTAVNITQLRDIIISGPANGEFGGVIITSARAVEVWGDVLKGLVEDDIELPGIDWTKIAFYVVGQATHTALANLSQLSHGSPLAPKKILGGSETGNAEKLAHYILHHHDRSSFSKFLYLTGDKNRDTLPSILGGGGFELLPVQVYATKGSTSFKDDFHRALDTLPSDITQCWIVYFAPSAADFVTPILREHFSLPSESVPPSGGNVRLASIGPTTTTFLRDTLKLRVDVTAAKPNPDALVTAILHAE